MEPIGSRDITQPFHVSASVSFRWDALLTARTATIEEDVLTELLGREAADGIETEQPWIRVDIALRAGLDYGKSLPMPSPDAWTRWLRETSGRLEDVERIVAEGEVRGPLPAAAQCRQWDDPNHPRDDDPDEQLAAMFKRVKAALFAWGEMVDHLLPPE